MSQSCGRSVVACINLKSGGKRAAHYVLKRLCKEYGEDNVLILFNHDDVKHSPAQVAGTFFTLHKPDVIVVAGGDGTISFIMDVVKDLQDAHKLAMDKGVIAPFPLGTGNDLSVTMGMGTGFARWVVFGEWSFQRMLKRYRSARVTTVDRYMLSMSILGRNAKSGAIGGAMLSSHVMNNYFSIGFDAAVAGRLDAFRKKHPHLFVTRPIVKLWYAYFAARALFTEGVLWPDVTLCIDGKPVAIPANTKALVVSNVLTYAGGSQLWDPDTATKRSEDGLTNPSIRDGHVEVISLSGIWHLAFVRMGICHGTSIGQGRCVMVDAPDTCHAQYDGEYIILNGEGERLRFTMKQFSTAKILKTKMATRRTMWAEGAHMAAQVGMVVVLVIAICIGLYLLYSSAF